MTEDRRYPILYVDPPWNYKGQTQHNGKGKKSTGGALSHYDTLTLPDLKNLPINELAAPDCLLFMWTSSPHLPQALDLMDTWGFDYATIAFVWDKQKVNPGFYTMSQVEICLVSKNKRGKIPLPRGARNIRQFLSVMRGAHSAKPVEVRERIRDMFPIQRKLELFAREEAYGWESWGLDVDNDSFTIDLCANPQVIWK